MYEYLIYFSVCNNSGLWRLNTDTLFIQYIVLAPTQFKYFFFIIASGVGLSPLYCGHFWPIVPAADDR
jgi:hypothetical protein